MWNDRLGAWILPGTIVVAILTVAAVTMRAGPIEEDLTRRALERLSVEHAWASVTVNGRNLTLSGTAPSREARAEALAIADGGAAQSSRGTWGVRAVDGTSIVLLPVRSPYVTGARLDAGEVTLEGYAPSQYVRRTILEAAGKKLSGRKISDRMELAAGAPDTLGAQIEFALAQLGRLASGAFSLSDGRLSISGTALDKAAFDVVNAALNGILPAGLSLASSAIEPPITPVTIAPPASAALAGIKPAEPEGAKPQPVPQPAGPIADEAGRAEAALNTQPPAPSAGSVETVPPLTAKNTPVPALPPQQAEAGTAALETAETKPQQAPGQVFTYLFNAEKTARGIILSGSAPNEDIRAAFVAAAGKAGAGPVRDALTLQEGAPGGFAEFGVYATGLLAYLESGSLTLFNGTLSLRGVVGNPERLDAARADLSKPPAGLSLGSVDLDVVKISPYVFSLIRNGGSDLILSGYLPSSDLRKRLVREAERQGLAGIADKTVIAAGEGENFADAADYMMRVLAQFADGSILLSDRKIAIDGTAASPEAYDLALKELSLAPEGFEIVSAAIERPLIAPYVWQAVRKGDEIGLAGFAPDEETRAMLLRTVERAYPGGKIADEIRLADGAPASFVWKEAALSALFVLRHLKVGTVSLNDAVFSVSGEAASPQDYDAAHSKIASGLPSGVEKGEIAISRPAVSPYSFSGRREAGGRIALSGYAPGEAEKAGIVEIAKRRFGRDFAEADIGIARGAPENFAAAVDVALLALSRLAQGYFEITDTKAVLSGAVPFGAPFAEIESSFENAMPTGFSAEAALTQTAPPLSVGPRECEARIRSIAAKSHIYFQQGRASILSDSFGLLDNIAASALSCESARFEIAGHTDSDGSQESNQRLSEARARSVAQYLIRAGIAPGRLETVGLGEREPVADNETPENKALNRRIEFKLAGGKK